MGKKRVKTDMRLGLGLLMAFTFFLGHVEDASANNLLSRDQNADAVEVILTELSRASMKGNERGVDYVISKLTHDTSFALGLRAQETEQYELAEKAFQQTLKHNPNNARARLELARTMYEDDDLDAAEQQFTKVMEEDNPPPNVEKNIQRFMNRISDARKRSRYSGTLTAGILYDDNVNVGPEDSAIRINPFTFFGSEINTLQVSDQSRPKDAWGLLTAATLFGEQDFGERGHWSAIGAVNYYQTHLDNHSDFETLYASVVGGARHTAKKTMYELPLKVEQYWRGGDELLTIVGVVPTYLALCDNGQVWRTVLNLEDRDYEDSNDQDSIYIQLSQRVKQQVVGINGATLFGEVGIFYEDADKSEFTNYGIAPSAGAHLSMTESLRLTLELAGRFEWYDGREALAPKDRRDQQLIALARLEKQWNPRFSSGLQYQFSKNFSTFDVYDFERNLVYVDTKVKF